MSKKEQEKKTTARNKIIAINRYKVVENIGKMTNSTRFSQKETLQKSNLQSVNINILYIKYETNIAEKQEMKHDKQN